VVDHDAPDPTVMKGDDGFYYTYTTQSGWPTLLQIPALRSKDLIHWKLVGDVFPENADWVTVDVWAPHATRIGDVYLLYYSARQYGRGGFAIGVARSVSPGGPFTDKGKPLIRGRGFVAIDPFVMSAPDGRNYIYWGSDSEPIRVQQLSADGMSLVGKPKPVLYPSEENEYEGLVEGAWVVRRNSYYYLMYSGDACCEPESPSDPPPHYAVMVARSKSPLGPFTKYEGNPILESSERFYAPGHNGTIRDEAGQDWMIYHAFEKGDITNVRKLMLDPIEWVGGWPVVNGGEGPSSEQGAAPVTAAS
jgi:arabinan endo-1,5-alpha-L-arabinosidase